MPKGSGTVTVNKPSIYLSQSGMSTSTNSSRFLYIAFTNGSRSLSKTFLSTILVKYLPTHGGMKGGIQPNKPLFFQLENYHL